MRNQQRRQNSDPLHYRLYVVYFEGSKSLVKSIKTEAFYRLSIWHHQQQVAEMMEGVNPTVLAEKIFLRDAKVDFELTPQQNQVKLRLWYHLKNDDSILSESLLDLGPINRDFFQQKVKYHPQQSTIFEVNKQELKLVFNIFVDSGKKELASYIRIFKQQERDDLKQKRLSSSKDKEKTKSPAKYNSIVLLERKSSLMSKVDLGFNKEGKNLAESQTFRTDLFQSIREEKIQDENDSKQHEKNTTVKQTEEVKNLDINGNEGSKLIQSIISPINSTKNYLQIQSAARLHLNLDKNINKIQTALEEIDQKGNMSLYSSEASAFHPKSNSGSKGIPFGGGAEGTSIISDGSEASEMIANNLSESYSQRAVAKFKATFFKFVNISMVIITIVLLYMLFVPRARFTKNEKPRRAPRAEKDPKDLEI